MKLLALVLLGVSSLFSAAFTATQSGAWSATSTWGGAGPPGNGDTATLAGFTVTVTTNATVGTSGVFGTAAVTAGTTSQLIINGGATFTIRGDYVSHGNGDSTSKVILNAGAIWEFDASAAASPAATNYKFISDNSSAWVFLTANGTSGSHCIVRSNAGGGTGYFDGANGFNALSGGLIATYTDFLRLGANGTSTPSSAFFAWRVQPSSGAGVIWDVQHCTFTSCGGLTNGYFAANWDTNRIMRHKFNVHAASLETFALYTYSQNAVGTGERTIANNVFDVFIGQDSDSGNTAQWTGMSTHDNYFGNWPRVASTGLWTQFQYNFFRVSDGLSPTIAGDTLDNYFVSDIFTAPHNHNPNISAAITTVSILRNMFDATGTASASQDGIVEDVGCAATSIVVKYNIVLPVGDGTGAQGLWDMRGECASIYDSQHNDMVGGPPGMVFMECLSCTGVASRGTLANNIFYSDATHAGLYLGANFCVENTITDLFVPANVKNNVRFNLKATNPACSAGTNQGNSYIGAWSVTPGGSDLSVDPQYVDKSRNLVTFDTAYLKNIASVTWASQAGGHTFAVGDIVSDQSASYYGNATINYRCTSSHTKSTANSEPGVGAAFHTYWEFASLNSIRNAVASSATITDAAIGASNATYIVALTKWVQAGFAPKNQALKAAGSDGLDIGAVPVVSAGGSNSILGERNGLTTTGGSRPQ